MPLQRPASVTDAFLDQLVARVPSTERRHLEADRGLHRRGARRAAAVDARRTSRRRTPPPARRRRSGRRGRSRSGSRSSSARTRCSSTTRETTTDLIQAESGKNRRMAIEETCDPVMVMSHYLKRAPKLLEPVKRGGPVPLAVDVDRDPPAQGGHRDHRALELPVRDRHLRLDLGADGRQRHRAQARQQDRAVAAVRRADARGGRAARGPLPGRVRRGSGRRADADRQRQLRDVHRLHRDRPGDRRAGRPQPDRLLPRARRQEPDDRARGRQPRRGRAGRACSARSATPARSACTSSGCTCPTSRYDEIKRRASSRRPRR